MSYYLAVGDFNNDGNLDIVVANLSPSTVDVYLGNGNGTFKTPISSNTTEGSYFVTVGDFNNDGKLDIAVIDPTLHQRAAGQRQWDVPAAKR